MATSVVLRCRWHRGDKRPGVCLVLLWVWDGLGCMCLIGAARVALGTGRVCILLWAGFHCRSSHAGVVAIFVDFQAPCVRISVPFR
jgi:hypothetical protein